MRQPLIAPNDPDFYPGSDGRPMAETGIHVECIFYVLGALVQWFDQGGSTGGVSADGEPHRGIGATPHDTGPDVYVAANMFLYYERQDRGAVVAPDVFVARGVPTHPRDSYQLWREPKGPDFVLEVTSKSTRNEDLVKKRALYASLGVQEYFLHDPRAEYLTPPLQGYRLRGGGYEPLASVPVLPGGGPSVHSAVLGLDLREARSAPPWLRLHDPVAGRDLPTHTEEAAARRAAEAQIAELKARLREAENAAARRQGPPRSPTRR